MDAVHGEITSHRSVEADRASNGGNAQLTNHIEVEDNDDVDAGNSRLPSRIAVEVYKGVYGGNVQPLASLEQIAPSEYPLGSEPWLMREEPYFQSLLWK